MSRKKYTLEKTELRYADLPKAEREYMWYRKAYYTTVYACHKNKQTYTDRWYSAWAKINNVTTTKRAQKRIAANIDKIAKTENVTIYEAIALYAERSPK